MTMGHRLFILERPKFSTWLIPQPGKLLAIGSIVMPLIGLSVGQAKYVDYANDVHNSGQHLLDLINDIFDLSKIDAGNVELHDENIVVAALIGDSASLVRERAQKSGVGLETLPGADLPLLVADKRLLKQILLNLLSNAIKFTPAGGRVMVKAAADDKSGLRITVADTGIGINPEDIAKAMSPYSQIDSRISRKHQGTGLGLPISRSLARMHDGDLEVSLSRDRAPASPRSCRRSACWRAPMPWPGRTLSVLLICPLIDHQRQGEKIEQGEAERPPGKMLRDMISHIENEPRQDHAGGREDPTMASQQIDGDARFQDAVGEKVENGEAGRGMRQTRRTMLHRRRCPVAGIFLQFRRREPQHQGIKLVGAGDGDQEPQQGFDHAINAFHRDGGQVDEMRQGAVFHPGLGRPSPCCTAREERAA